MPPTDAHLARLQTAFLTAAADVVALAALLVPVAGLLVFGLAVEP